MGFGFIKVLISADQIDRQPVPFDKQPAVFAAVIVPVPIQFLFEPNFRSGAPTWQLLNIRERAKPIKRDEY